MRLYLHIGTHKTGTTAVQHFLASNRERLEEVGVLYPEAGCPPVDGAMSYGQHLLAHAITRPDERNARAWQAFREELTESQAKIAIVSSEEFDVLSEDAHFAELVRQLEGIPVTAIAYLRRQDEFLHSYYCTDVLWHGERREFDEYRQNLKTNPDYRELLSGWEKALGREAIRVRVFARDRLLDGDVVTDICDQIGLEIGDDFVRGSSGQVVNRAYPRNVINCILWARNAGMDEEDLTSLRSAFVRTYEDVSVDADFLSPDDRRALLREFAPSNAAVAQTYLGRPELFSQEIEVATPDWNRRYHGPLADFRTSIEDVREICA